MEKYKDSYVHSHVRYIIKLLNTEEVSHQPEFKSNAAVPNHKRNYYTVVNRDGTLNITGLNCETRQKEI
jgi:hypothetical protein